PAAAFSDWSFVATPQEYTAMDQRSRAWRRRAPNGPRNGGVRRNLEPRRAKPGVHVAAKRTLRDITRWRDRSEARRVDRPCRRVSPSLDCGREGTAVYEGWSSPLVTRNWRQRASLG